MNADSVFLTFTVNKNVTVYILYDSRIDPPASFLSSWDDAGLSVEVTDATTYTVYKKSYPAGTVSIPGNRYDTSSTAGCNYIVVLSYESEPDWSLEITNIKAKTTAMAIPTIIQKTIR